MTRKDLRIAEREWRDNPYSYCLNRSTRKDQLSRKPSFSWMKLIIWTLLALCLYGLYVTSPSHLPECQGDSVPRHCVD